MMTTSMGKLGAVMGCTLSRLATVGGRSSRVVKLSLHHIGPMIRSKGTFNMRQFSLKLAFAGLAGSFVLAGCGGGSAPNASLTEVSCHQPWSWANGSGSGSQSFSSKSITPSAEVNWNLQNCNLKQLSSAQLTVCISHAEPDELILRLYQGTVLTPLTLPKLNQASPSGTCGTGSSGTPWTYTISSTSFNSTNISQQWRLVISDEINNQTTGFFDGWSFTLKGLN
jgi:hypothetical protein